MDPVRGRRLERRHSKMSDSNPALKYPWQRAVFDVFREFDPQGLPAKIEIAERAIAERLGNGTPVDESEHLAIDDVQRAFQLLCPRKLRSSDATAESGAA